MLIGARTAALGGKKLPYDYEVEWLQSDGVAYVDTGVRLYSPTNNMNDVQVDITADFCVGASDVVPSSTSLRTLTSVGSNQTRTVGLKLRYDGARIGGAVNTSYISFSSGCSIEVDATAMHKARLSIDQGPYRFYVDDSLVKDGTSTSTSTSSNFDPSITFLIFARHEKIVSGKELIAAHRYTRCKSLSVESNGSAFHGRAVCKDGVGYFYDEVSGQLFGNAAKDEEGNPVGELIMGPRVG